MAVSSFTLLPTQDGLSLLTMKFKHFAIEVKQNAQCQQCTDVAEGIPTVIEIIIIVVGLLCPAIAHYTLTF